MTAKRKPGKLRRLAGVVDAAMKDADLARKQSSDPRFQKAVRKDRRGALSSFRTVQHALEDRERMAKAKKKT